MSESTLWGLALAAKHTAEQSISSLKAQIEQTRNQINAAPRQDNLSAWINEAYEEGGLLDVDASRGALLELKDYLRTAQMAWARFEVYQPVKHGIRQCPHCWVNAGVQATLTVYGEGDDAFLKCLECGENLSPDIEAGAKPLAVLN